MKFIVLTDSTLPSTLLAVEGNEWIIVTDIVTAHNIAGVDACFDLREDSFRSDYTSLRMPVFINSVTVPLSEISCGTNVIRINGWPGFLEKVQWEIAGEVSKSAEKILTFLQKKYMRVKDEPGFISARIISMVINEAYFTEEDKVSSREDIDIALRLGTNYPFGPFEWANKIGIKNIYYLLKKLSLSDDRYTPSAHLKNSC